MSTKKGAPLPDEQVTSPTICFRMEIPDIPEYRQAVTGLLTQLGQWYFWEKGQKGTDERGKYTAEMFRQFYYDTFRWEECVCNCEDQMQAIWIQSQVNDGLINQSRLEAYDGTPESVDPDAPTTNFDYDGGMVGEAALCNAVKRYVEKMVLDTLNKFRVGLGLTAVGAGGLGWLVGPLGAVVGGIAVLAVGLSLALVELAASDAEAMNSIICQLKDLLAGRVVTEAEFNDALNDLTSATANEAVIVLILKAGIGYTENYLFFLAAEAEAKRNAEVGIDNCPCSDDYWCKEFLFSGTLNGWSIVQQTGGVGLFGVVESNGIAHNSWRSPASNGSYWRRADIQNASFFGTTVTKITVVFDTVKGTENVPGDPVMQFVTVNGAQVWGRPFSTMIEGEDQTVVIEGNWTGVNTVRATFASSVNTTNTYSGSSKIKYVKIEGKQFNPFGSDDCEPEE